MKKKVVIGLFALAMVAGFSSCKPKQSAYKAVYEKAQKQREIAAMQEDQEKDEIIPVVSSENVDVRPEKVVVAQGENADGLRMYSVVIGSFLNATNARSLKDRMASEGFNPILAQNEQGMYRVIVTSFDNKVDAVRSRDSIKSMYTPAFQDAWILERTF
ncbi:SPOR domain-containing protein [Porphyromonadaceae bacterium W3.11]|nr:SPOR domain-containing protein [Porphyromonadaceae bacterium W3.11]